MEALDKSTEFFPDENQLYEQDKNLNAKLVAAYVRRFRGSDVRLDLGNPAKWH